MMFQNYIDTILVVRGELPLNVKEINKLFLQSFQFVIIITYYLNILGHMGRKDTKLNRVIHKIFYACRALPGLLWTIYLVKTNNQGFIWTIVDITSAIPTFVNVFVILILSGTYFKLLKDYKARKFGIGKVDPDMPLFYEDKIQQKESK